jgi:hypothetical protein
MVLQPSLMAAGALGAGSWFFWKGFRALRTVRLIENTPTARIRSMAMGLVELHGRARERSSLIAPFSGNPCAYWEVDISVRGRNRSWTIVHRNHSGQPFFLEDETGVALVYPEGAECRVHANTEEECFGLQPPSPYAEYLHEHGSFMTAASRLSMMRFRERTLDENMVVYVLGTAEPRSRALVVSEGEELAATGTDGRPAAAQLHRVDQEYAAIVRQGENEPTFIISQEQERDLATGLRWKAGAMILGGPLLALLGLGYWLATLASLRGPG